AANGAADRGAGGLHDLGAALHGDAFSRGADLEFDVDRGGNAGVDRHAGYGFRPEACFGYGYLVQSGGHGGKSPLALFVGRRAESLTGRNVGYGYIGRRNGPALSVDDRAIHRAGGL